MALKFVISIVLMALSVNAAFGFDANVILAQQRHIFNVLKTTYSAPNSQSRGVARFAEPDDCFDYYLPEQEDIYNNYQKAYNLCLFTAANARKDLTLKANESRTDMVGRGHSVCNQLSSCEQIEDGLQFFQCYNKASNNNYGVLYSISEESNNEVSFLQRQYEIINSDQKTCTTTCRSKYVASMAQSNKDLDKCLDGGDIPTKKPTTTTTERPWTSTTEIDIITTSVAEDSTTEDSASSTAEDASTTVNIPSTTEDASSTVNIPSTTEDASSTVNIPSTTEDGPTTTDDTTVSDSSEESSEESSEDPSFSSPFAADQLPEEDIDEFPSAKNVRRWGKYRRWGNQ